MNSPISCYYLNSFYDISLVNNIVTHCCKIQPVPFNKEEFDKLQHRYFDLNSHTVRARQDMANGIRTPACKDCWDHEDKNIISWRQLANKHEVNDTGAISINLQISTLCNLACYYCSPTLSSGIRKYPKWIDLETAELVDHGKQHSTFNINHVQEFIKTLPDSVNKLNLSITGGEPFMMLGFEDNVIELAKVFLAINDENKVVIAISTNTSTDSNKIRKFYENIKSSDLRSRLRVHISVSIENIEERAEYVRGGLVWSKFEENLKIHVDNADEIVIRMTVNPFSVVNIVDTIKYFSQYKDIGFVYNYPIQDYFKIQILDDRFIPELLKLEEYVDTTDIVHRFEDHFYKKLKSQLLNDKENAVKFKRAITNLDGIRQTDWAKVFPEYIDWFNGN